MDTEIEFTEFSSWEDFDLIVKILSKELKFRLKYKAEGPDARAFKFSGGKFDFWLVHDDLVGNFLKTENLEHLEKLKEIVGKVEAILKS